MSNVTISVLLFSIVLLLTSSVISAEAQSIPSWIKNTAGWWADGTIDDESFVSGIEWLVSNNIIEVPSTAVSYTAESTIPDWIKNTAGWWADNQISDDDFVNAISYLIQVGIITVPQSDTLTEIEKLLQKRENLIDFIWSGNGFPTHFPDSIEQDISDKNFDGLKNLKKIDRITVEMKHDLNSIAYLLYPKEQSSEDLIIYHTGHGQSLHDGVKQIRFFLDRGYPVLVFSMPINGMNNQPVIMLDGNEILLSDHGSWTGNHDQLEVLESDKFSPISYFVEPIAVTLNYIDKNFDYSNYHMTGISGGGWTTIIYPAIDSRISHGFSVAGSHPDESMTGDYEQSHLDLYQIASYEDLYVLASFGEDRKLSQIFHVNDECCYPAEDLDLSYEETIKNRLASLGSGEFQIIITQSHMHMLSVQDLLHFYLDIDEKNEKYFSDIEHRLVDGDLSALRFVEGSFSSKDASNKDFTGSLFDNFDLSFSNLNNSNFFSAFFINVDFSNTDMINSDLSYTTFCDSKIENAVMHNVDFSRSKIIDIDFTKNNIKNAKFDQANCINCIFDNMDISEIKIRENDLGYTNFPGSSFKNVDFRNWEHGSVDFSGKFISSCAHNIKHIPYPALYIGSADLTASNFSGSNLKDIVFSRGTPNEIITLNNADFSFADLSFHDLRYADLKYANLSYANLTGVNFTDADLEGANLTGANLKDANLGCYNHKLCNK